MYSKLSDAISDIGSELCLATMNPAEAEKRLEELKTNPELAKQLINELSRMKPGQKPVLTAGMGSPLKALIMSLMFLAPAAFADEGGLNSLKMMMKNPSNITMEKVNQIQDKAEKTLSEKQQDQLKEMVKNTEPGAILSTPHQIDIKGVKFTPTSQGQAGLAQKAVKMLNDLGSAVGETRVDSQKVQDQAKAFVHIIQGLHS